MFKRPLLAVTLSLILFSVLIVYLFPTVIYPKSPYSNGETATIICRIQKIEEKENSFYIFVSAERYTYLLCAAKTSIDISDLKIGNTICASAVYSDWSEARNYGNFDEGVYYRSLGVCRKFYLNEYTITNGSFSLVKELCRSLKNTLIKQIKEITTDETSGIFTAIICGDKSSIDEETNSIFQMSGIAHILAISGLHVSFLGLGIFKISRKRLKLFPAEIVSMSFILFYAIMCGFTASSFRAVIMLATRFAAVKIGKKYDIISSMSLAAALLMTENPFIITNSGFILSFTAILSVAAAIPVLSEYLRGMPSALISSLAITSATLPVIVSIYYEFPLYGFLINIPVLWLLSYILAGAFCSVIFSIIWSSLGKFILGLSEYLTELVIFICKLSLKLPFSRVIVGHKNIFIIILYYTFAAASIIFAAYKNHIRRNAESAGRNIKMIIRRSVIFLASITVLILMIIINPSSGNLTISFIDVDQGKCILLSTPHGSNIMIDGGSTTVSNVYKYRVEKTLKYKGVSRLDHVFVTHPDSDHISAIIDMAESGDIEIMEILIADFNDNENYQELIRIAQQKEIKITELYYGLEMAVDGADLTCINGSEITENSDDINDMSSVIYLSYGSFSALFTGDISTEEEETMINNGIVPQDIDLLDVAHHGSKYSSCEDFLNIVMPEVSVISAGVDNSYGHPHLETLNRLKAVGTEIYSTIDSGEIDITVYTDGNMKINTYLNILK